MDRVTVEPSKKGEHQDGQALKEETKRMAKLDPDSSIELSGERPDKEQVGDLRDKTVSEPVSEGRCSSSKGSRHPSGAEASSGAPVLLLGGAGEPSEKLDMAKMVKLMSKAGCNSTPVMAAEKDTPSNSIIATNITSLPDMAAMMTKSGAKGGKSDIAAKMADIGKPNMADMAKGAKPDMAAIMAKGGMAAMMGNSGMPDMVAMMGKSGMPDMAAMMGKSGMPDMMAMMGKSGMPDMAAMMGKSGMPDMMAMMAKSGMPDMMAMMGAGAGPLGMKKMMDCIIEVTFARPDSDESDDDEDSVTIEIPCKYCSRFFTSQMSLKTHILVAHDHQDTSVLNIRKLVIDSKGKCGVKEKPRRKQSKDCAASAASSPVETTPSDKMPTTKVALTQELISAADADSSIKRNRSGSGECKAPLPDAASSDVMQPPNIAPKSSAVSSSKEAVSDSVSGSRKRRAPSSSGSQSQLEDSSVLAVSKRGKIDRGFKACVAEDVKMTAQPPVVSAIVSDVKTEDGAQLKQVKVSRECLSQPHISLRGKSFSREEKEGLHDSNKDLCLESKKSRFSSRSARHRDQQSTKNESVAHSAEANSSESSTGRNLRSRKSR